MKRLRWQILLVFLALIAIGVLLLGQQPTVLLPDAPVVQPSSGGVYSEALIGEFGRLNPLLDNQNPADRDINHLLFSGLIRFDDRGIPRADLAESWGISKDGTVYNFSIRPQAIWHDGKSITSEDVIFTVDLMRNQEIPIPEDIQEMWNEIEVNSLDEKTLQFILPEPYAPFLDYLTFGLVPKHLLDGMSPEEIIDADFNLSPVGSGPFKFEELLSEEGQITGVVLNKFDRYYQEPPFIEQMVFYYFPSTALALEAYRAGELLGISEVAWEALGDVLAEPELNVYTGRLPQQSLIFLNLNDPELPFFQDDSIRKALLMALNRQWLVDHIFNGQAFISDGPILPGSWAYFDGIERVAYNPENALAIIKDAGYTIPAGGSDIRVKDDIRFEFELIHPDTDIHTSMAMAIKEDWEELGIRINLRSMSYDELLKDHLETRNYDAALVDIDLSQTPDPDPYPFWDQAQIAGGQNYSQWDDRQASEYIERARINFDLADREKDYGNFQVRFVNEMPALPILYPVYSYAVNEQVQGVRMGPLFDTSERFATLNSWYLVAKRTLPTETATVESP